MSKLEELIQQYCPDGVEWKTLNEVVTIKRGERVTKAQLISGGQYPVISGGVKPLGNLDRYNREANTITIAQYGTAGYVDWQNSHFWANDVCYSVFPSKIVSNRFLYYVLLQNQELLYSLKTNAIPACLPLDKLTSIEIPIPPLPVQEEIVRILDTFTELQAELQAELQKRLQQYNYYRDNLLTNFTPDKQVKEYSLGELGTFTRGNGLQKKDFTETGIGCIHYGQIYTRYGAFTEKTLTYVDDELASHLLQVEKGDLVIACTSENVEDICKCVAWLGEENICTGGHACVFRHKQNPKYISYFFQTEYFFNQKVKYTYGTKVKDIKPESLAKIKILLPSLEEQERIVSILDNLYTLTTDLSQGLPAEIEKRRQQYEYYRDKLLTFKRKEA